MCIAHLLRYRTDRVGARTVSDVASVTSAYIDHDGFATCQHLAAAHCRNCRIETAHADRTIKGVWICGCLPERHGTIVDLHVKSANPRHTLMPGHAHYILNSRSQLKFGDSFVKLSGNIEEHRVELMGTLPYALDFISRLYGTRIAQWDGTINDF